MEIKLSKAIVKIKDYLTWGDNQKIQDAIMSGAKMAGKSGNKEMGFNFDTTAMFEAKYVALECAVLKITEGEKEFEFNRDWMNGLTIEDGDKLMDAVDSLSKKK